MYTLKVKQEITLPDGRLFLPDHDVSSLTAFEVAELVSEYPNHFEAADQATTDFLANGENVAHLAAAVKQQRNEGAVRTQGGATARKTK